MPKLSVIGVFYNMKREAARTLWSLHPEYQIGVCADDYEVIAVDNGSSQPLSSDDITQLGDNFRYVFYETDSVSPVAAVNAAMQMANGLNVALIVDGARMATPGLIRKTLDGLEKFENPFVCALSWHLGPDEQNLSMLKGYQQESEDRLLEIIQWPENGYKLFDIAAIAPYSLPGFYSGIPREGSWFAMRKAAFVELGGFDIQFQSAGGGLVNHDFRNRVMKMPNVRSVALLGEGVFHQYHGGISTNVHAETRTLTLDSFQQEYKNIRGVEYTCQKSPSVTYVGDIPEQALRFVHAQGKAEIDC